VPATMESTVGMKAATAVDSASASVEPTANTPANAATCDTSTAIGASTISVDCAAPVAVSGPIAISRTVAEARATIEAVIPRSGADKDSAHEVIRAVIAVGRASIRVIAIIPVSANRSGANTCVDRANTDADADTHLSLRVCSGKKQNPKQCKIL
jgi:hypothetical protein